MFLWAEICALVVSVLVGCLIWYFYFIKSTLVSIDDKLGVPVIKIVEAILKVCPVGSHYGWTLLKSDTGSPRCWLRHFPLELFGRTLSIYGTSAVVKGSSLATLKMITNTVSWCEWKPTVAPKLFSPQQLEDPQLREDDFMRSAKIMAESGVLESYRFSHLSSDNLSWALYWDVKKINWFFFLVQPLVKSELEQCMLTYIFGCNKLSSDIVAVKELGSSINSIKDAIEINCAHVVPVRLPLLKISCKTDISHSVNQRRHSSNNQSSVHRKQKHEMSRAPSKVFKIVPYTSESGAKEKKLEGFTLSVETVTKKTAQEKAFHGSEAQYVSNGGGKKQASQTEVHDELKHGAYGCSDCDMLEKSSCADKKVGNLQRTFIESSKKEQQQNIKDSCLEISEFSHTREKRNYTISGCSEIEHPRTAHLEPMRHRCFSDLNIHERTLPRAMKNMSLENLPECDENITFDIKRENKTFAVESSTNSYNGFLEEEPLPLEAVEYEILLPELEWTGQRLADMITNGNYAASELQVEVLEAFSINLQSSIEDQTVCSGGWSFHSTLKGITVLSKASTSQKLKIVSYACATDIPVKPSSVWAVIRNPHIRFICDETVKKVRILQEISSDQKIVYTYHESSHMLRKEPFDFCLLHTERKENTKYYLALQSIEYENCPLMDSAVRGTLLPSGWVVQPLNSDDQSTKVIFLSQVIVSSPNCLFTQDLSTAVPMFVYNLKKYVMLRPS